MAVKVMKPCFFTSAFMLVTIMTIWERTIASNQPLVKIHKTPKLKVSIMQDVTFVVKNSVKLDQNITQELSDVYDVTAHNLANLYYNVNENLSEYKCMKSSNKSYCAWNPETGIAVIFNKNTTIRNALNLSKSMSTLTNETLSKMLKVQVSVLNTVVVSFSFDTAPCVCTSQIRSITTYLNETLDILTHMKNNYVNFAIEYNERFLDCCKYHHFAILRSMDEVILQVELTPVNTMLSYEKFSKMMDKVVCKNWKFIRKVNPECTIHIRFVPRSYNESISGRSFHRYEALMLQYFQEWSEDTAAETDTQYIVRPSFKNITLSESTQYLKEKTAAALTTRNIISLTNQSSNDNCGAWDIVNKVETVFNHTMVIGTTYNMTRAFVGPKCNSLAENMSSPRTVCIVFKRTEPKDIIRVLEDILVNKEIHQNLGVIYFDWDYLEYTGRMYAKVEYIKIMKIIKNLHANKIKIGCYIHPRNGTWYEKKTDFSVYEQIFTTCAKQLPMSRHVILQYVLSLPEKDNIINFLSLFRQVKEKYEMVHPHIKFVPMIEFESFGLGANFVDLKAGGSTNPVFCSFSLSLLNEHFHTVLGFANIHKWETIVFSPASVWDNFWSWRFVQFPAVVHATSISVFLNPNSKSRDVLPMTHPCIKRTEIADKSGIKFDENYYSGISFDMKLRKAKLTMDELKMAMSYTLRRFYSVELIVKDEGDIQLANSFISLSTLLAIKHFRHLKFFDQPVFFIEVHKNLLPSEKIKHINHSRAVVVVINGWNKLKRVNPAISNFGIIMNNCDTHLKANLDNLKKWKFYHQVKYIQCNQTLSVVTKYNKNGKVHISQLLLNLYYIKSYVEKVLNTTKVEVVFKINLDFPPQNRQNLWYLESRLAVLHQLNQFSAFYKIRCFIGSAFESERSATHNGTQYASSWWRVTDYSKLANASVYVDQEDEHFHRHTNERIPFPTENVPPSHHLTLFYISFGLLITTATLLSIVSALWIRLRRAKKQFLTEKEISQFYNGCEVNQEGLSTNTGNDITNVNYMKFESKYEISLGDLQIGEIIGSGQFGVVHKGTLLSTSYSIEVAIKIPRPGCDKEQFKSTLSELKILCYIGSHTNIVSFMGAYTKEIANAKLYIVTVYYANGSLESYLRKMQELPQTDAVDIRQLKEFAFQIASGMKYVAEKRVIHGDLATRNVLLSADLTCKIGDFGLSRRLYEMAAYKKTSEEPLPWRWMAPESLNKMEFTTKSDVWSYAVTLWEIFSLGKPPYPGMNWTAEFESDLENGERMGCPQYAPLNIYEKMLACWNLDPLERPTFSELWIYFLQVKSQYYLNDQ